MILPPLSARFPLKTIELERLTPFALFMVKLFNAATLDGIVIPVEVPPKTRFVVLSVVKLVGTPVMEGPLRVSVLPETLNVLPSESVPEMAALEVSTAPLAELIVTSLPPVNPVPVF